MKIISTIFFSCLAFVLHAQTTTDYVIKIEASTQKSPAQITLKWETPTGAGSGPYNIFRKNKGGASWGNILKQVPSTANTYSDNTVTAGTQYEYFIYKNDTQQPYGYISAAIEAPAIHNRGAILLLVDSTFTNTCSTEISTLMKDLSGDGWKVLRKDLARTATVAAVKSSISSTAKANPDLQGLYILGHIAVPYSGDLNPDAHPNHKGAWPADVYYADLDGTWTDNSVNDISSGNTLNHNTPGDGKFDQSYIPSDVELQTGRVDFYDMPAFSKTEEQMMKSYLNKAHQYKSGTLTIIKRGLVDDNFKTFQEAFGGNGWRNFSAMVGIDSVSAKDFISTLNSEFYQWAYGCGGGTYTSCGGIGSTTNFVSKNVKSIFTPLFGSYFGDWNYKNNFLRAPLCADEPSLASFWAGRPNWFLHHMALGENIGYSTRLSQNNNGTVYATPIQQMARMVTIALMGDPSLRTDYIKPVPNISLSTDKKSGAIINWTASPEPGVAGYYVYRSTSEFGEYKIRSQMVTGTSFIDSFGTDNTTYWYMVRATELKQTPSGTYYNLSLGFTNSGKFQYPYIDVHVAEINNLEDIKLYPNPAKDYVTLEINSRSETEVHISVIDMQGKVLYINNSTLNTGTNKREITTTDFPAGIYIVNIRTNTTLHTLKMAKTN